MIANLIAKGKGRGSYGMGSPSESPMKMGGQPLDLYEIMGALDRQEAGGSGSYGKASNGQTQPPVSYGKASGGSGYGSAAAVNGPYGGCAGQKGGCGSNDWDDSNKAGFSDLGANLKDIDWSKEKLEAKAQVSSQYWTAAAGRGNSEVDQWREKCGITVEGRDVANPIFSFEETGFPQYMLDSFKKQGFKTPTEIQSQGWGPAMAGRDVVGVAKTGSGKTLAFGIPGLLHIAAQPPLQRGDGPLMLVLAPTRELAIQIEEEMKKVMPWDIRGACCYGGAPRRDQKWQLEKGVHVIIATPGRLIDFLDSSVTNLRRVTYLVMDEADRMLDMGFEPDVRKIVGQIRPDRQTLLWSATWPKGVQRLARDFQKNIIQINVGNQELAANNSITQEIIVTSGYQQKLDMLFKTLSRLEQQGATKALVFAGTKKGCQELADKLHQQGYKCAAIHGDKEQAQREKALWNLKQMNRFVLVATDVASRGLDVPNLPLVINFDFPEALEDYVHRIGRTGRAGKTGTAVSFLTPAKDCGHAAGLIKLLQKANQNIPPGLERCTTMQPPEKKSWGGRKKGGGGGGGGWGSAGLKIKW